MSNKPEATFRVGPCSASVFVNDVDVDGGKRQIRSVSLQRSYLEDGDRKYSTSFGLGDLPQAIRALQLAQLHVESEEANGK